VKRYSEYKNSGIRWIGEIPANWDVVKLKRICRIKRGASPRPIDDPIYFDDNGERYWVRIADVTRSNKYLVECEQKLSPLGIENSVKIDEGDLFISICASVGKPCISQVKACIHDGFVLLDRLPTPYKNYIYYIFVLELPCHGLGKIGTQLNLNSETIGNIDIPLHDNIEPICAYLDRRITKIDELLADLQSQADLLDRYKRELIADTVTHGLNKTVPCKNSGTDWIGDIPTHWDVVPLRAFLKIVSTKNNVELPLLSVEREKGVVDRETEGSESNHNHIPDDLSNYKVVKAGQFVMNKMKAWRGSYGVSPYDGIVSPAYYVFNLNFPNSSFFNYAIRSSKYVGFFGRDSYGIRTDQWDFKVEKIKDIPFAVPPVTEQQMIVEYLDNKIPLIESLIADINKQIEKLKQYRQIVIHDAVTGKIKVKEKQDNGN